MIYYYKEIKSRLIFLAICWFFTFLCCLKYKEFLFFNTVNPIISINKDIYFIYTNFFELFLSYLKLILFFTNQIFYIFVFYQMLLFVSPGLYNFEYKSMITLIYFNILLLVLNFKFIHSILIPKFWYYFIYLQESLKNGNIVPLFFEAKISEYIDFYAYTYYLIIILNQLYICLYIYITFYVEDLINFTKASRKIFYFIFILCSTFISTPDITTQFFFSFIMVSFYELLLLFTLIRKYIKTY